MNYELFNTLVVYGDQFPLKIGLSSKRVLEELKQFDNDWVQYNPRKSIERFALSITNLDGKLGAGPDLDSLPEYNRENGTDLDENDFIVPTPVYDIFKECFDPFKEWLVRCHAIQLRPGGYFPPHIDNYGPTIPSFRLFIPLENCNPQMGYFIMEDRILYWDYGRVYFINTCKRHLLFNPSFGNMTFVVLNVILTKESVSYFLRPEIIL